MRSILAKLHLLMGVITGVLIFIIALTGCIYAFQQEIQNCTQPFRFVQERNLRMLPPSVLAQQSLKTLPGKTLHAVMYQGKDHAAKCIFYNDTAEYYHFVYLDPYSAEVLQVTDENSGFFHFILNGHYYLWLPHDIGRVVVSSATIIFLVMIISGIILWWPRNKKGIRQRFTIQWSARWRRRNYDMHQVTGFYVSWLAIIFVITGLVWGFEWFQHLYYGTISFGNSMAPYSIPSSVPQKNRYS